MADLISIFGGSFTPPEAERLDPPEQQLIQTIAEYGYNPPKEIIFDGKIHRFNPTGKKKDDSGWYVAFAGKIHAGSFGDWKDGHSIPWREELGRELTAVEQIEHANTIKRLKEAAELEKNKKHESAAESAQIIWEKATEAEDQHAYLLTKQVKAHGLKVTGDGRLIVPAFNSDGEMSTLQFIDSHGDKKFFGNGKAEGAFYYIPGSSDAVYICEGYATAATIHEVTGGTVYIAFNAGNLSAVAQTVRANHSSDVCLVADHDEHGVGKKKADEAAKAISARVVMPEPVGMDANDYHNAGHDLSGLLARKVEGILVDADELCQSTQTAEWWIKGYVQKYAFMMTHGPSGVGKSFVVLDQCLHIATGRSWLGHKTKQGKILFLAGEGQIGLRNRIKAWKQHHKVKSLEGNVKIYPVPVDIDQDGMDLIIAEIEAAGFKPDLTVVDTVNRYMAGDENRSNETRAFINNCANLQLKYKSSVQAVHHTGNSDEAQHRARGSSAWKGALDIETSVLPLKEDGLIVIKQMKSKDTELADPIYVKLESIYLDGEFDEDGDQINSAVIIKVDAPKDNEKGDKKLELFKADFIAAWNYSGGEMQGGCRYVSTSALRDFIDKQYPDKSDSWRQKATAPSAKGQLVHYLLENGIIEQFLHGYRELQSGADAASVLILKGFNQ